MDRNFGSSAKPRPRRAERALFVFFLLNVVLLFLVALQNSKFCASKHPTPDASLRFSILLVAEAVALLLPALAIGLVLARFWPRTAQWLGSIAIALVTPWYYLDFSLHRVFGLRLIVSKSWELIFPVLRTAGDFTLQSRTQTVVVPIAAYLAYEATAYALARASWRWPGALFRPTVWSSGIIMVVAVLLSIARIATAPTLRALFLPSTDPHPIHVTGMFDKSKFRLRTLTPLEQRCVAQLVAAQASWHQVEERYRNLAITDAPAKTPDVVLIIVESLRSDALTPETAPYLERFAQQAVVADRHYSAGNATHLGYFGIMYGLNALWLDRAISSGMPPALPSLMKQLGYHRALLGSWSIDRWHGMDRFLNSETFDHVEMVPLRRSFADGDDRVVQRARAMLDRRDEFTELTQPLFLVVQINATHYEYHSEPQDQILQPITMNNPPWTDAERPEVANRYGNSVHCMDRIISPLLGREHVVIVAGDHGESFGEDGFFLHCSALSAVQVQTPFLIAAPNIQPKRLNRVTSHLDVIPTLLDVLGCEVNDATCLHGRNIFDSSSDHTPVPIIVGESRGDAWLVMDRNGNDKEAAALYRFACDPFSARFRLEGVVEPQSWSVHSEDVNDGQFARVFESVTAQLCAGSGPELPDDAYAALLVSLRDDKTAVRRLAIQSLAEMHGVSHETIPILRKLLEDEDPSIRAAAANALSKLKKAQLQAERS